MHHPKVDVERLYVTRREGKKGLMQLEMNLKPLQQDFINICQQPMT